MANPTRDLQSSATCAASRASVDCVSITPQCVRRAYCAGDSPTNNLNAREKCAWSVKPSRCASIPLRFAAGPIVKPLHSAEYWERVTAGFDFSEADQVPTAQFNRVLWTGLMGDKPYPVIRSGFDASKNK